MLYLGICQPFVTWRDIFGFNRVYHLFCRVVVIGYVGPRMTNSLQLDAKLFASSSDYFEWIGQAAAFHLNDEQDTNST